MEDDLKLSISIVFIVSVFIYSLQSVVGLWHLMSLSFFLQELIEVDSDVVFELASYILQVRFDFNKIYKIRL